MICTFCACGRSLHDDSFSGRRAHNPLRSSAGLRGAVILISIAMCTYNGSRFLDEQLRSIASQTLLPDELVVCDDGSSDETIALLEQFAASSPFPVRIFCNIQNLGSTGNFEKAIGLCNGELIALCDQDDIWKPQKLRVLHDRLTSSSGGVFSDADLIDDKSQMIGRRLWQSITFTPEEQQLWLDGRCVSSLLKRDVATGATMLLRSALRDVFLPVPNGWIHDAWIAWMVTLHSRLEFVPEPLMLYRVHSEQQLGVPAIAPNFRQKFERAKQTAPRQYQARADQLATLLLHLESCPSAKCAQSVPPVRGQIEHCRFRARARAAGRLRVWEVLSRYPQYSLYSEGITSMIRDLLIKG